jgi:hypothetical protein
MQPRQQATFYGHPFLEPQPVLSGLDDYHITALFRTVQLPKAVYSTTALATLAILQDRLTM